MPVYELGYRAWEGKRTSPWLRWAAISRAGIALGFRSKIVRRLLYFAWVPLIYFGGLFFAIGYLTDSTHDVQTRDFVYQISRNFLGKELAARLHEEPESARPIVWSMAFHRFLSIPQGILMILLVAIAGAPLIAQDVGSKAFLLYFSKPVTRAEYLLGKAGTVFFFIFLVTLFPALALYVISIAVSPSFRAVLDTIATVPAIVASSLVVAVPSTCLILFLSSLARDARYVAFGWFAIWILGEITFWMFRVVPGLQDAKWLCLVSLWECLNVVTASIFDVGSRVESLQLTGRSARRFQLLMMPYSPVLAGTYLAAVSAVCLAFVTRRVSAPMRI